MEFLGTCHTCGVLLKAMNMKLKHLRLTFLIAFLLFSFLASISFFVVPVHATGITHVQGNARGTTTSNSITVTMALTPVSGNVLIAIIRTATDQPIASVSSITQTDVAWSNVLTYSFGYGRTQEIWIGIVSASASTTITIALANTCNYGGIANVCEYSGIVASNYLDKTANHSGWSTTPTTGTTDTTTQDNELWIGAVCVTTDGSDGTQTTPQNGFTLFDGVPVWAGGVSTSQSYLEKIVSSKDAASSGTSLGSLQGCEGFIATFFAAAGDTTPPTYSLISANTTVASALCNFNCLVSDDTNVSTYIFSTNNTGTWTNDTTTTFSNFFNTTAAWANVTKTLNGTIGNVVSYLWYANDTSNNWSSSEQFNLTLRERPNLQITPDNVTCRKILEIFNVQINVTNAVNIQAVNFTIYYDPSLLNCSSVTSGELAQAFTVTFDTANGILEGKMAGSPINGNRWLLNITFQANKGLIWKEGLANKLESRIWFHQAEVGFSDNSTLKYVEGGVNQITVNQMAYTFLPIRGDVNNDGTVNIQDIRTVAAYYGKTIADPEWPEASKYDLTNNNTIDIFDLILVATNFGFTYP